MTTPSRDEIVAAAKEGRLLDLIFKGGWRSDSAPFSQALIDAHQSKDIDLRSLLPLPEQLRFSHNEMYLGIEVFLPALGSISTSCTELLELMAEVVPHDDPMLSYSSYGEIVKWCQASPERLIDLLQLIKSDAPLSQRFHCVQAYISAGLQADPNFYLAQALEFLEQRNALQRAQAARALCNLSAEVRSVCVGLVDTISAVIERETDPSVRDALLALALDWQKDTPVELERSTYRLIERAACPITLAAKKAIGLALMGTANVYSPQVRQDLLALLSSGQPEEEVVKLLDIILAGMIRRGDVSEAQGLIEKLILGDATVPFTGFTSVLHELESRNAFVLDRWVVRWLHSDSLSLALALRRGLFAASEGRVFTFDFSQALEIPESDYLFIAHKALGTFFSKPLFIASLIVSLMRNTSGATLSKLEKLLFDPVLINYSGLKSDYLDEIAERTTDLASQGVQRALQELHKYLEGLGDAHIRELQPSERQRQLEQHRRNEQMQNDMVEARASSIMADLVSEQVLLYGTGMASWVPAFPPAQDMADGDTGPMRRIEQSLATVQHIFQIPRQSVLEPSTLEIQTLNFLYVERT